MTDTRYISLIMLLTLGASLFIGTVTADPSDTPADAQIVELGKVYNGTMTQYNDLAYYNFSGSHHRTYNFTFWEEAGNYLILRLYDGEQNLLGSNDSLSSDQRSIIWTGENEYIIGIFSSEFAYFPADFNFTVTEVVLDPGEGIASAIPITVGSVQDTFTKSLDEHWFNFTADVGKEYNITMKLAEGNFSRFTVYDQEMETLGTKYDSTGFHSFVVSGSMTYVLNALADFEFIVLPNDFTVEIFEIVSTTDPLSSSSTTSTSNSNSVSSTADTGSKTESEEGFLSELDQLEIKNLTWALAIFTSIFVINSKRIRET